ncbi:MAG: ATP synthase F1 subunit gamma [Bacteroidales bacterium]|nr:ATP synthase F1 subunit gamma [Bacteroidales bacterium]
MAVSTKLIKRRLKSIGNTKKITKAMEMIATVKMRKAVESALKTRVYAKLTQDLLNHLAYLNEPNCPLLETRSVKKILLIMVSSNRGLCGSFNANIFRKTANLIKDTKNISRHRHVNINEEIIKPSEKVEIEVFGLGRKSALFAKKNNLKLVSVFDKLNEVPIFDESLSISKIVLQEFLAKNYDKVLIAYTDFKSSLIQEPKLRQLLPVSSHELEKMLTELGGNEASKKIKEKEEKIEEEFGLETYLFEPDVETIINEVLPKLVEIQLYQAMLESAASEHSARMVAMKSASDAASDMIFELNLNYNKARQAGITQEIAEISAGASTSK